MNKNGYESMPRTRIFMSIELYGDYDLETELCIAEQIYAEIIFN